MHYHCNKTKQNKKNKPKPKNHKYKPTPKQMKIPKARTTNTKQSKRKCFLFKKVGLCSKNASLFAYFTSFIILSINNRCKT